VDRPAVGARSGGDAVDQVQQWLAGHGIEAPERPVPSRTRGSACAQDPIRDPGDPGDPGNPEGPEGPGGPEPDADPESVARTIVLRKLSTRACTRQELERALAKRSVPPAVAARVLDRMEELRLVDDAAFAADWVASRQQRRHLSAGALQRELTARGVARDQVSDAVAGVGEEDEYVAALDLAQRRTPSLARLAPEVRYRRLAGVLARRGFGSSVTARVLREVLDGDE